MPSGDTEAHSLCTAPMAAAILAAGLGSRMGGVPKAAILVGGQAVLHWQAAALREAGIDRITVVTGSYPREMKQLTDGCGVQQLPLPPRAGQTSPAAAGDLVASQRAALRHHLAHCAGHDLLLLLGDLPLLRAPHIHGLVRAWATRSPATHALVPVVAGVRGHPVLLSAAAVQAIVASPDTCRNADAGADVDVDADADPKAGVRCWMRRNPGAVRFLPQTDPAYTQDVDTLGDLARIGLPWRLPASAAH